MTRLPRPLASPQIAAIFSIAAMVTGTACGDSFANPERLELGKTAQAIVGGDLDESTQGVVGLAIDMGVSRVAGHCSGTLIAPNLVLTAQHCIAATSEETEEGTVQCDRTHFGGMLTPGSLLISPEAVRPGNTDDASFVHGLEIRTLGTGKGVCGQDIALVILDTPIFDIQPIVPRVHAEPVYGEAFSTVGYGLTDPEDPRSYGTRQRATGSAVRCTGEDCVRLSDGAIRASEWASIDAPICSGDSGGPALDMQGRVFGVASRGDLNCEVAVYGDVSSYGPFIVDTALEAASIGGYPAPAWTAELTDLQEESDEPFVALGTEQGATDGCSMGPHGSPRSQWWGSFMVVVLAWTTRRRRNA